MATLGYWPHSETMPSAKSQTGGGSKTATAGGAKTLATGEGNGAKMAVTEDDVVNSSTGHNVQGEWTKERKVNQVCLIQLVLEVDFLKCNY